MSPLPRQGWLFLIEFLKWYFSKYWQVRTRPVFAQTVTIENFILMCIFMILWSLQIYKSQDLGSGLTLLVHYSVTSVGL